MENQKPKAKKREPIVVPLKYIATFGSEEISEITLRPPTGKDVMGMSIPPTVQELVTLASKLSGHPRKVFEDMDSEDALMVAGEAGKFLGA